MANLGIVLLVFAFVLALIAAGGESWRGWNLGWLAVAFWIASELFGGITRAMGYH